MNSDSRSEADEANSREPENHSVEAKKATADEQLQDPQIYKQYDEAMGELSDADGASSLGGPAA
jgi:hypothetical protein